MARARARIPAWSLTNGSLDIKASATIKLYEPGTASTSGSSTTGTPFTDTVYTALSGGSSAGTTHTADGTGQVVIFCDNPRRMDVGVSGSGISPYIYSYETWEVDALDLPTTPRTGKFAASARGFGVGVVSNRTALVNTISEITSSSAGRGEITLPAGTFEVTDNVPFGASSGMSYRGAGVGATTIAFNKSNTGSDTAMFGAAGTASSALGFAVTPLEGVKTVTLGSGGVASMGLAVGDMILISEGSGSFYTQYAIVRGISGEVVSLSNPLYHTFDDDPSIVKITPVSDITISDMTIDGSLATGDHCNGIYMVRTLRLKIQNVTFKNFRAGSPFYLPGGYGLQMDNVTVENCGDGVNPGFYIINQTGAQISNVLAERSVSFGPDFSFVNGSEITNLRSSGSTGRGMKITGSCHNLWTNIRVENADSNGLSIVENSHYNHFVNVKSLGNATSGIWIGATPACTHNSIENAHVQYSGGIIIDADSNDNRISGDVFVTGITNNGLRNILRPPTFGQQGVSIGANADPTNATTTYATMDGDGPSSALSVTLTTTGGNLRAILTAQIAVSVAGNGIVVAFSLDGAAEVGEMAIAGAATTGDMVVAEYTFTGVSVGSHTVAARWKAGSGATTITGTGTRRRLTVSEGLRS